MTQARMTTAAHASRLKRCRAQHDAKSNLPATPPGSDANGCLPSSNLSLCNSPLQPPLWTTAPKELFARVMLQLVCPSHASTSHLGGCPSAPLRPHSTYPHRFSPTTGCVAAGFQCVAVYCTQSPGLHRLNRPCFCSLYVIRDTSLMTYRLVSL